MKKLIYITVILCNSVIAVAQNTVGISTGTRLGTSGNVQVGFSTGRLINNGTMGGTKGTVIFASPIVYSGTGTAQVENLSFSNTSGVSLLNSLISVTNTANLIFGNLDANNNLFIRSDLNNVANLVVSGTPGGTVQGLTAMATPARGACPSFPAVLSLNVSGAQLVYQWQSSSDSLNWSDISGATTHDYAVTISATVFYRCRVNSPGSTFNQFVNIAKLGFNLPSAVFTNVDSVVVGNTASLIPAQTGGVWTSSNPSIFTVNSSGLVTGVSAGTATITYQITNISNCSATNTAIIKVNNAVSNPNNPVLKVNNPSAICSPATVDLSAVSVTAGSDAGLTFTYYTDAAGTQILNNATAVSASGTYYIKGTSGSASTPILPVLVTINPLPSENILTPNGTVVCGTSPVLLSVTAGNSCVWAKDGVVIPSATTNQLSVTGAGGVYGVTITTASGCTAPAKNKIIVTSLQAPVASFAFNTYCTSIPVNFVNSSTVASSGSVSYAWSDNNGNSSTVASPSFTYTQVGTYPVKLKVSSVTCPALIDSITKPIAIEKPTAAQRLSTVSLNNNDPVQLQARTFGATYSWTPGTGLSNSSIANPTVRLENETDFTIRIVAASGCVTVDSLLVKVFTDKVYVPAAFTPNGDGLNDKLFVNLIGMKQLQHFTVYNRYGKKMFETSSVSEGWDGTFNGTKQPMDTYVWTAEGLDKYGFYISTRGSVTLIR